MVNHLQSSPQQRRISTQLYTQLGNLDYSVLVNSRDLHCCGKEDSADIFQDPRCHTLATRLTLLCKTDQPTLYKGHTGVTSTHRELF